MIRLSYRALGIMTVVLVAFTWVGWQIISGTAAYNLARSDPTKALTWEPGQPDALYELARLELTKANADLGVAQDLAQRGLRSSPLNTRALSLLGIIAEREGNAARADSLMRLAGARTWSDPITHAWLFQQEVKRGDFVAALTHADAILRSNHEYWEPTFPELAAFTRNRPALEALAAFLGSAAPPWRGWFLTGLSNRLASQARLIELYESLKDGKNPPTVNEMRPYLFRLIKDGRFAQAYQSWRETLPAEHRKKDGPLYNGDFAAPVDGLPFNWVLTPAPGVDIQIVAGPDDGKSRLLRVQFSGARVVFDVSQLVLLPPGAYRLSGKVRADDLRTERGLWWRIFCADAPGTTLATTKPITGTVPWTDFAIDFTVPGTGCGAQWLRLELPARIASERQIEGQVWYASLGIAGQGTDGPLRAGQ